MVIFGWPGTGYGFNTVVKSCVFLCVCVCLCVFSVLMSTGAVMAATALNSSV